MKVFTEFEQQVIKMLEPEAGKSLQAAKVVQDYYFTSASNRALILQTQANRAVFFMTPDVFDDVDKKAAEVKSFLEFVTLLHYLSREGYVTLYREKTEPLYFFQEDFLDPKTVNNNIVLNSRGDYTTAPDTIHNKDNTIIYKGVVFNTDVFEMVLNCTTGVMIVSENIGKLNSKESMEQTSGNNTDKERVAGISNRLTAGNVIALGVGICSIITHTLVAIYLHKKAGDYDENFRQLSARHDKLQATLNTGFSSAGSTPITRDEPINTIENEEKIRLYGMDISKWNGNEASELNASDSISFIICKATEGLWEVDRDLGYNWKEIREKKSILGAYHFFVMGQDPARQAEHFWNTIRELGETDIAPIVDVELLSIPRGSKPSSKLVQQELKTFLIRLEKLSGRTPMIYTSNGFAEQYISDKFFSKYPLWLAEYTNAKHPRLPEIWKERGYTIWQKRDNYFIDSKPTDFDVFFGKLSELVPSK